MFLCAILKDMKQKCKKVFITTLFILGFVLLPCFADDGHGYIDPYLGGFVIEQSDSIEMTEEIVEIWEDHVKVTFWFTNLEDTPQDVTIGFPVESFRNEKEKKSRWDDGLPLLDNEEDRKQIEDFYQFTSTCNGQELPRTLVANAHKVTDEYDDELFDFWFTSELHFEANEVLEVVDEYHYGKAGWVDSMGFGDTYCEYILTTGSSWANVIKKATIYFHTSEYKGRFYHDDWILDFDEMSCYYTHCSYEPTSITFDEDQGCLFTWELQDIKPDTNWVFSTHSGSRLDAVIHDADIILFLLKDELQSIPEYYQKIYDKYWYYFDNEDYEGKRVRTINRIDYKILINTFYSYGFTTAQPKTEAASIYAQFLINSIYALHGYQFQNAKWTDIFSQFSWYKPSAGFSEASFTAEEQAMIKRLQEFR